MHRHGYKGRKFGRENDQRRALIKGLASDFINHESITTTVPKAKELVPYVEKLITKAKIGDLHNRRLIIGKVAHPSAAHKLVDEIAPKLKGRDSGHLRLKKTGWRRGDNAEMANVSFVDELTKPQTAVSKSAAKTAPADSKKEEDKPAVSDKPSKLSAKTAAGAPKAPKVVAKRTGIRGNR